MNNFYNFSNVNNNMILENLVETFLLADYFLLILVITLSLLLGIKIHMKKYKTQIYLPIVIIFGGYLWFLAVENKHMNIRFEISVLLILAFFGNLLLVTSIFKLKKTIHRYLGSEIQRFPFPVFMAIPWLTPAVETGDTSNILLIGGLILATYSIIKVSKLVYSQYIQKEVVPDKIAPELVEPEYVELSFSGTTHIDIEPLNLDSVKSSLDITDLSVPEGDKSSFDFVDLVGETVVELPIQPHSLIVDGNLLFALLEKMTLGEQFFHLSVFGFTLIGAGAAAYIHIRRWLQKPEVIAYVANKSSNKEDDNAADRIYNSLRDLIRPIPGFLNKKNRKKLIKK